MEKHKKPLTMVELLYTDQLTPLGSLPCLVWCSASLSLPTSVIASVAPPRRAETWWEREAKLRGSESGENDRPEVLLYSLYNTLGEP